MDHVMNYQEFLDIAEKLRPWTEQAMKIEVAPWIRDYVVDMDDLYSDLTLEKVENKPARQVNTRLKDYRELFRENEVNAKMTDSLDDDSLDDVTEYESTPSVLSIDEDGPGLVEDNICASLCSCFKSLQKKDVHDIPKQSIKSSEIHKDNASNIPVYPSNNPHHSPYLF